MNTFLHQPRLAADDLFSALRVLFPQTQPMRSTTTAGVEVVSVLVASDRVRDVWDEWRGKHGETGWWPYVSLISPEGLTSGGCLHEDVDAAVLENMVAEVVRQDHDARAASIVVSSFLWSADHAYLEEGELEEWLDDYDPDRLAPRLSPAIAEPLPGVSRWVAEDPNSWYWRDQRWLHFVPARGGYEVPVMLPGLIGTGNGTHYLPPVDDAALLRRWHEQWGAELYFASGSYLELVVDRPPLDPRSAAQAATELTGYCEDTVEDPRAAGDGMVRSTMWTLWWD
ncbi:DUF4253 domain-containing protein [Streptomyces sp. NPDC021080]|uniref:DUF4253 domain-containing protein n=1 Tax=Streptomyces sp. NPDC021080 TaxID=3365110 RepID=UPI00379A644F